MEREKLSLQAELASARSRISELEASLASRDQSGGNGGTPDFDAWIGSAKFKPYKDALYQEGAAAMVKEIKERFPDLDLSCLEVEEKRRSRRQRILQPIRLKSLFNICRI